MENLKHGTRKKKTILQELLMVSSFEAQKVEIKEELTKDEINNSMEQMNFFEENSKIIANYHKDKKHLKGDENILNHGRELKNYKLIVSNSQISIVDKYDNKYKYGYFSLGNNKLKSDENTTFLIWNIIQKVSCKYSTTLCRKNCYANKAPNCFARNVLSRSKNLFLSTFTNFENIFMEVIELINKIYGSTTIRIRIHESGDFYNVAYYKKIANVLNKNKYQNMALAYTKNIEVLPYLKDNKPFFNVRFSIMEDTSEKIQKLALSYNCSYYIVMDNVDDYQTLPICNMGCTKCALCHNSNITTILCKTH